LFAIFSPLGALLASSACVHKVRGSEGALKEEKQGTHTTSSHQEPRPAGCTSLGERTTPRGSLPGLHRPGNNDSLPPLSPFTPRGSLPGLHRPGNKESPPSPTYYAEMLPRVRVRDSGHDGTQNDISSSSSSSNDCKTSINPPDCYITLCLDAPASNGIRHARARVQNWVGRQTNGDMPKRSHSYCCALPGQNLG